MMFDDKGIIGFFTEAKINSIVEKIMIVLPYINRGNIPYFKL